MVNGMPISILEYGLLVDFIGSNIRPKNIDPLTKTSILTRPITLQFSILVVITAHLPPVSLTPGETALLVFTTPQTLANTFEVAHGFPLSGVYVVAPSIILVEPIAYIVFFSPPRTFDSVMFRIIHDSISPKGIFSMVSAFSSLKPRIILRRIRLNSMILTYQSIRPGG